MQAHAPERAGGRGPVLLVEDNTDIRELMADLAPLAEVCRRPLAPGPRCATAVA